MKSIKQKIALFASFFMFGFTLLTPATVLANHQPGHPAPPANTKTAICEGVGKTAGVADCSGDSSLDGIVKTVIDIMSMIVGVIAVIMIIIGGIKYVTSSGDSNNVNSAKNTILYAVIGLVVVALAQVIVRFVLGKV